MSHPQTPTWSDPNYDKDLDREPARIRAARYLSPTQILGAFIDTLV